MPFSTVFDLLEPDSTFKVMSAELADQRAQYLLHRDSEVLFVKFLSTNVLLEKRNRFMCRRAVLPVR
jgi:hypothetical protein